MDVNFRFLRMAVAVVAVGAAGGAMLSACTKDANDPGAVMTGSGGMRDSGVESILGTGTGGTGGGGTGPTGTACASPIIIPAGSPGIADFDAYDGVSDLATWSFPLGGDSATGAYAGPFGYGDRANGLPETFDMVAGQNSKYALRIADTLAQNYGGGLGTWLSACLNATNFAGLSFWVRGSTPMASGTLTLSMQETLPSTPAKAGDAIGTCAGTGTACVHPTYLFNVTDTWTQVQVPWASFTPGNAAGTPVTPNGRNITQIQFAVALIWAPDANGVYAPTPAPYELVVDTMSFF